ncbi:MAG: hypothetical protein ACOYJ2_00710 [Rickettsiales bacterium]
MFRPLHANAEPALPISDKKISIGGLLALTIFLPACEMMDLSVKYLNFDKTKAKSNQLAVLNIDYDEDEFTEPYQLELVRMRGAQKGYALRAPLYKEEKGALHFSIAKQKEFKWFVGLQGRWEF